MTVLIMQKSFVVPASSGTGNIDFTTLDLGGLTPKGVIIRVFRGGIESNRTANPGSGTHFGAYDGSNQTACCCVATSGSAPSGVGGSGGVNCATFSTRCLTIIDELKTTEMAATGSALITNGVRLNLLVSTGLDAFTFDIVFFAGTDVEFACGTGTYDASVQMTTTFRPEAAVFTSVCIPENELYNPDTQPGKQRWQPSQGFACQTPTGLVQAGFMGSTDETNPVPAQTPRVLFDGIAGFLNPTTQVVDATITVTSFSDTGIVLGTDDNGPEAGLEVISWAAFTTGGVKTWDLQTMLLTQTVSTTFEQMGVGFKPDGIFFLPSGHTAAVDTIETVDTGWGFTFSDGGNEGGHHFSLVNESGSNDDVVGSHRMVARAISSFTATANAISLVSQAFVSEIGTDGFTLDIEANSGVAEDHKIPFMTFGEVDTSVITNDGRIAFATGSANTSTGNQNFTAPLGGAIPKGAMFIWSRTTDDVSSSEAHMGLGYVGQNGEEFTATCRLTDNATPTTAGFHSTQTARCIDMIAATTDTSEGVAEFVTFIANGITVNWTTAPPVGWIVNVVLFSGTDVQTSVRNLRIEEAERDQMNCGFKPDFVFLGGSFTDVGEVVGSLENPAIGMGFLSNEAVPQTLFSSWKADVSSSKTRSLYLADSSLAWNHTFSNGSLSGGWTEQFKAEGLQIEYNAAGGVRQHILIFSVKMPGLSIDARAIALTAGTGTQSFTGFGFKPTHLFSFISGSNADGSLRTTNAPSETIGVGFFDGLARQRSMGLRSDFDLAITDTGSFSSNDLWLATIQGIGTVGNEVEVTSLDSDGFTVDKQDMTTGAIIALTVSFGAPVPNTANKVKGNWL